MLSTAVVSLLWHPHCHWCCCGHVDAGAGWVIVVVVKVVIVRVVVAVAVAVVVMLVLVLGSWSLWLCRCWCWVVMVVVIKVLALGSGCWAGVIRVVNAGGGQHATVMSCVRLLEHVVRVFGVTAIHSGKG